MVFVISFAIFTILIVMCGFSLIYQITHSVKYSSIGAFLIMVPTGEYYVYCFRNQSFIAYVLFSYIHLYLYILLYNALGKGKQIILSLLIFVLTFLMGCCGLRFFSITILPIIACEVWTMFKNNLVTNKINIKMSSLYRMLLILLPALSGFGVFCTYIKKTFGPFGTTNAILNNGVDVLQHLSYTPMAIFDVFGGFSYAGDELVSKRGILQIIILFSLFLMYSIAAYSYSQINRSLLDNNAILLRNYVAFAFGINVFLLAFTSLGKAWGRLLEIHYLSIGMFAFFPLIIVLLKEIKINEVYRHACVVCFIAFVFVCNIGIYNRESGPVMKWVNVLMDNDFSFGYATNYWNGSYVTAMTNEKVEVVSLEPGVDGHIYKWGTKRSYEKMTPEFIIVDDSAEIEQYLPNTEIEEIYREEHIIIYKILNYSL